MVCVSLSVMWGMGGDKKEQEEDKGWNFFIHGISHANDTRLFAPSFRSRVLAFFQHSTIFFCASYSIFNFFLAGEIITTTTIREIPMRCWTIFLAEKLFLISSRAREVITIFKYNFNLLNCKIGETLSSSFLPLGLRALRKIHHFIYFVLISPLIKYLYLSH